MPVGPGQDLLHYRLVEKIGEGGMGVVWKADDMKLDRQVAVKVLPEEFSQDTQRLARFEREAKLLAALNHPNIAAIYGFEAAEEIHFLVLELVDGQTLAEAIRNGVLSIYSADLDLESTRDARIDLRRGAMVEAQHPTEGSQQDSLRSCSCISSSLGCVYTVVVRGETWRAKRCARNRSRVRR